MTHTEFLLVAAGHRRAFDDRPGSGAPDMQTHRDLVARYG